MRLTKNDWDILMFYLRAAVVANVILFSCVLMAHAESVQPPHNLWKGLIAEAVSEGPEGMVAVCLVYRNRLQAGMRMGCSGLKRRDLDQFVARQGSRYERMAKDIVARVFSGRERDVTMGATHYENITAFGMPWWAKSMRITARIGSHTFFK
ncbi:MAG: cell wall hydrolase [Siphoviridae sp. ctCJE6]|nr:MAG: cell wall hydrolase [Siphoviridae sp. ctCJE6]